MKTLRQQKLNNKGQGTVEAILILVILIGIAATVSSSLRSNEAIASVVSGPWRHLNGIIQNGVWQDPSQSAQDIHPNYHSRHASNKGEPSQ